MEYTEIERLADRLAQRRMLKMTSDDCIAFTKQYITQYFVELITCNKNLKTNQE